METLISVLVGILFAAGTYMILSRRLLRIVFGTSLLSNGTLLFLMLSGKLQRGESPILTPFAKTYADPLPQAMILTAIVINFAITAFCLVLCYRTYHSHGSDDVDDLTGKEDEHKYGH
ncbi:Na(+)/H(+) antiporter subunit C [Bacilliculturomica massiliensis]|uniref:Na(+)/H(+) antiporter subunit C n=1 Tax=Bacilliculturomica massiliensis TaxID=1917867 RepID=UPI0010306618|nr:Na(+)/H(+) antiporter subunit C [Bacilliculturomica massiliensis]